MEESKYQIRVTKAWGFGYQSYRARGDTVICHSQRKKALSQQRDVQHRNGLWKSG